MPNKKTFIIKIADLFIEDDESSDSWKKDARLLSIWYILFWSGITLFFINLVIATSPLNSIFEDSLFLFSTSLFFMLYYSFYLFVVAIIFVHRYYQHTIGNKRNIYLINIVFFYFLGVVCFFYIYYYLHCLYPTLFIADQLPPHTRRIIGLGFTKARISFILFSASQGINNGYLDIRSNSLIISIITYIQSLYTLSLIILFISGFINQKTK
jgi:hypothetical protein